MAVFSFSALIVTFVLPRLVFVFLAANLSKKAAPEEKGGNAGKQTHATFHAINRLKNRATLKIEKQNKTAKKNRHL